MNMTKILLGGIAAGVVYFFLGWLLYGMLCRDYLASQMGTAGMEKPEDQMNMGFLVVGNLAWGFLVAIVIEWSKHLGFMSGLFMGAIVGLLMSVGFDFIMLGKTNYMTMNGSLADIGIATVIAAISGGVSGLVMGMGSKAS